MLLEDAPIGTIHSFFSRLISPHLTILGEPINDDIVTDAQRETLRIDALMLSGDYPPTLPDSQRRTLNCFRANTP